jgi:hypothetical protein
MPESYRGRRERFYLDAISHTLAMREAPVVIIDNLSWLTRSGRPAELYSVMKSFRRWTGDTGRSMLVLRHSREDVTLCDQPAAFEMAHSIFALCPSTMGDNIRYLKALRTSFRIESGKLRRENSGSENSQFSILNSQLSGGSIMTLRVTESHRLEFAGVSPEELHLFDYAAHVKRVSRRLKQITQLHSPGLSLVPEKRINFLGITDGKPKES